MLLRRAGAVAAAGVLPLLISSGAAIAAEDGTAKVSTSTEAWYTTTGADAPGACGDPLDCSQVPEPTVYPENTLHVGIEAGRPTAATYLQLDTATLPMGSTITGGTLRLPVDEEPRDGSVRPDTAKLVACAVTEPVQEANGSTNKPPKTDCKAVSAPAKYKKGKKPAFEVDLAAFGTQWADGNAAVAILPAPEAQEARETWHVAFWGKENKTPGASPITATLAYTASADGAFPPGDGGALAPPVSELGGAPTSPSDQALAGPAPEAAEPLKNPPQAKAAPKDAELAPQAAPEFRKVGYPYPIAWTMPLVLLIGFVLTGRALTKKLAPRTSSTELWQPTT